MKKVLNILVLLTILLIPNVAKADSYRFNYYCDSKEPLNDGTFYMTCHLLINSDMEINHVKGSLLLKNVKLESIKTSSDWKSLNGLSSNLEFKSTSAHNGSFSVADFVFTGDLSDKECEASFIAELAEKEKEPTPDTKVCAIVDDTYYGKNGNVVSEEKYYEECEKYICTVVNNKYYFNSKGQSVSYDEMLKDCSTHEVTNPGTGVDYGYIILPTGIISLIGIVIYSKKNQKIYKI